MQIMTYYPPTDNYEGVNDDGRKVVIDATTYEREVRTRLSEGQDTLVVADPDWWLIWRSAILTTAPASVFKHPLPYPPGTTAPGPSATPPTSNATIAILLVIAILSIALCVALTL